MTDTGNVVLEKPQETQAALSTVKLEDLNEKQLKHLENIEELLQQQLKQNVKMRRAAVVRTIAIVVLVAVVAVALFFFYNTFKEVTAGLPDLIAHADTLINDATKDLEDVIAKVNEIDFEGINEVISGVAKIDFDALNESIQGLAEGVENFRRFTEALSNPFRIGS